MLWFFPYHIPYQPETPISHFRDRPVPIFSDARFSYLALVQDKKSRACYRQSMLYSLYQLPPIPILHAFPF